MLGRSRHQPHEIRLIADSEPKADAVHDDPQIRRALEDLAAGRIVILADPGPPCWAMAALAAEFVTPEHISFLARFAGGIVCLAMTPELCDRLALPRMTRQWDDGARLPFTVSIDARVGISTGISAADRAHTILTAVARHASSSDLVVPGHIHPLRLAKRDVRDVTDCSEAAVSLLTFLGLVPAAVLCAVLRDDGEMASGTHLYRFAVAH
jgi:3,4-dihydroxy 2-butanone 4-phosphate synthase/GTP cyclohydrolase II